MSMNDTKAKSIIKKKTEESGFYEPYAYFSRTLRTWLVGYGIGAPILIISQDHLSNKILDSGIGDNITIWFLSGVCVQVIAAILYKYSMGYIYFSELNPTLENTKRFIIADWISEAFWLELLFDILAIVCFMRGTYLVTKVVIG
jgi:hypothetical protein